MHTFVVVVPVKPPRQGKSRLGAVPDADRVALATAFALDTIAAARACDAVAEVMVVTDDHEFASDAARRGCAVIPDGVSGSLNGSLVQAAAECRRRWPAYAVAALCADLPALRPEDLARGLAAVGDDTAYFVPDHEGTGTTMYAAAPGAVFDPNFGPDSRRAHLDAGAHEITGDLGTLRLDVDDVAALDVARNSGLGTNTAGLLDRVPGA